MFKMSNEIYCQIKLQLSKCRQSLETGYLQAYSGDLQWLNIVCAEFLPLTKMLDAFLNGDLRQHMERLYDQVEIILLCLLQINTCIRYLEVTVKAENGSGFVLTATRQHFYGRINCCIQRLCCTIKVLANIATANDKAIEDYNFIELIEMLFEDIQPFTEFPTVAEADVLQENGNALQICVYMQPMVKQVLSIALGFANVALQEDKKALSALCQNLLRDFTSYMDECKANFEKVTLDACERKIKAFTLKHSLEQLEACIQDALLRLVFTCFLDYEKFSIDKLRSAIRNSENAGDPALDELIADFDVNYDRTLQIGLFCYIFAYLPKDKVKVRNCLASLEALDSCIIPALQSQYSSDLHSEILQQHFNEEIAKFKTCVQETIDGRAFAAVYLEIVTRGIAVMEKKFNKTYLTDLVCMANALCEHFQIPENEILLKTSLTQRCYDEFIVILRECQAILSCADQVDVRRILKRFRIMRTKLRKLVDLLQKKSLPNSSNQNTQMQPSLIGSIGTPTNTASILSEQEFALQNRSVSVKALSSQLPLDVSNKPQVITDAALQTHLANAASNLICSKEPVKPYRNVSLRTAMFKRVKAKELQKLINETYLSDSTKLEISAILEELQNMSARTSSSQVDKE